MGKNIIIIFCFIACCVSCFSQEDPRFAAYNDFFTKKDFLNALVVVESLISSDPQNLNFHREKAKMLAATNQQAEFLAEMQFIRDANTTGDLDIFFSALKHELVPQAMRNDLRQIFAMKKDTSVLLNWPEFSEEKVLDCTHLSKKDDTAYIDYSSNYQQPVSSSQLAATRNTPPASNVNADLAKAKLAALVNAANNGDPKAQTHLGIMYREGQYYNQAIVWLTKAASQGFADAQYLLGTMYYDEKEIPQDVNKAIKWFEMAADQGETAAMMALGVIYDCGVNNRRDCIRAYKWYSLAVMAGDKDASEFRDEAAKIMSANDVEIAKGLIREWLQKDHSKK